MFVSFFNLCHFDIYLTSTNWNIKQNSLRLLTLPIKVACDLISLYHGALPLQDDN